MTLNVCTRRAYQSASTLLPPRRPCAVHQARTAGLRFASAAASSSEQHTLRPFSTSPLARVEKDKPDPGGKPIPTDGSYRTVYDDFNNILATDISQLAVHSMGEANFTLSDGLVCFTPIILLQKHVLLWDPPALGSSKDAVPMVMPNGKGWEEWTDDVWRVFEVASPRPEIIIFGTGKTVLPPPPRVKKFLNDLGIQIEAHNTRNACSTYNMLVEEGRVVAAALLPNERLPTQRLGKAG